MDILLDVGSGRTRAVAVERALRQSIVDGYLVPGTRLPSTRELAGELGCARATVVAAYEQLGAEGYLVIVAGSGTTVANIQRTDTSRPSEHPNPFFVELLPGEPDPSSFPRQAWAAAVRKVLQTSPDDLLRYGDRQGLVTLREALAAYLARSRAVVTDPSRIVIFGGFAAALSALAATFHRLGIERVAVENPCLPSIARIVAAAGPHIAPIAIDAEGLLVEELGDVGAVTCTPAHQYPVGVVLSPARRAALVTWARESGGWIVEDDYDGEFRYDRRPVGALQGLDHERVIYGGTASKSLAPGVALAWLVLPSALLESVLDTMRARRDRVSAIEQAALATFIMSGRLDRHVRAQRLRYRRRRDAMMRILTDDARSLEVTGVSAGLHLTALLHDRDEREIIERAAQRSVAMFGLADHAVGPLTQQGLVIGYSRSASHAFPRALEMLSDVLSGPARARVR